LQYVVKRAGEKCLSLEECAQNMLDIHPKIICFSNCRMELTWFIFNGVCDSVQTCSFHAKSWISV